MKGLAEYRCNVISDDFLHVGRVNMDAYIESDDTFIEVEIFNEDANASVMMSLENTKKLIAKLQSFVDDNEKNY